MSAATSLYTSGQQLAATVGVSAGAVSLELARVYTGHALGAAVRLQRGVPGGGRR